MLLAVKSVRQLTLIFPQFLARNINKNLLNSSWVHVGSISGFSFDKTSTDLYLFNYSVVVIDENDKVVGCTTGRLSSGASAAPPTQGRSELRSDRTELTH